MSQQRAAYGAAEPGIGPLTALGAALVLVLGCSLGALLDYALVGGPAWGLSVGYLAGCGYTATKVRRADWFVALVTPPLAFAGALIVIALLTPSAFGPGLLGVTAITVELLAAKARALYLGAALTTVILCSRRAKARHAEGQRPQRPGARPRPSGR